MRFGPAIVGGLALASCGGAAPSELAGVEGDTLPVRFADAPASAERGRAVFADRDQGHCVLCHALADHDAPFQGNLGPSLDGVGSRLSPGQLRLRIAAPHLVWPDTVMPAYYRREGLNQVDPAFSGATILTGQQIEDVVAFLAEQTDDDADGTAPD